MTTRKPLSKKIRFEVFKRDSFTCQYCGKNAPDIVLHIDHINPVAKGGANEISNLITSCRDCNLGKKDKILSDDSVVKKSRKQLEMLQERREQIEMMAKWKEELDKLDEEILLKALNYITKNILGYSLTKSFEQKVSQFIKKFGFEKVLEATDISKDKYICYDNEGEITQESAENYLGKIGGILHMSSKGPISKELAYIKGICRNRFSYWDDRKGSIILNNYVNALKGHGWTEGQIVEDLKTEGQKVAKNSNNRSSRRDRMEDWTEQIKDREPLPNPEIDEENSDSHLNDLANEMLDEYEKTMKQYPQNEIDTVMSILLDKGYIIVGTDGVSKDFANFLEKNWKSLYHDFLSSAKNNEWTILMNETQEDYKKEIEIKFSRYITTYNTTSDTDTELYFETVDIIFNSNKKTRKQISEIAGIIEE